MDKRKNNGGHSTKTKGADKRKNEYRNALDQAADVSDVIDVIGSVLAQAKKGDLAASKLFLEYYLGKPTQTIDQNTTHTLNDFDISQIYKRKSSGDTST